VSPIPIPCGVVSMSTRGWFTAMVGAGERVRHFLPDSPKSHKKYFQNRGSLMASRRS